MPLPHQTAKIGLLLVSILWLTGCLAPTNPVSPSLGDARVYASFYPLAFVVSQIVGDSGSVQTIVPAGVEPHDYEPTARDLADLRSAGVVIYHGLGLDPWAPRIAADLADSGVRVVEATAGLDALIADRASAEPEEDEHSQSPMDPHVWLDPTLLAEIASNVEKALIAAYPERSELYHSRSQKLQTDLLALDTEFRQGLGDCELREIIVSHDAFAYLAARYDLTTLPIMGISPLAEPSPARLAELTQLAQQHDIDHIFFEQLLSPRLAETLASEVGAQTLLLDPLESITDTARIAGQDYFTQMRANLASLRLGLKCR